MNMEILLVCYTSLIGKINEKQKYLLIYCSTRRFYYTEKKMLKSSSQDPTTAICRARMKTKSLLQNLVKPQVIIAQKTKTENQQNLCVQILHDRTRVNNIEYNRVQLCECE